MLAQDDVENAIQELQKLLESVKGRLTSDELEAYRLIFKELEDLKNK